MREISYLDDIRNTIPTIENRKVLPTPPKYKTVRERVLFTFLPSYILPNYSS